MRIEIAAIGRLKADAEKTLCERYLERAVATGRALGLSGFQMREASESRASQTQERKREEAAFLLAGLETDDFLIALDERGRQLSSVDFSDLIDKKRLLHKRMVFVLGGADGLHEDVRQRANVTLAFGAITLPHQMARAVLSEQLYRATTILTGHPYHRV